MRAGDARGRPGGGPARAPHSQRPTSITYTYAETRYTKPVPRNQSKHVPLCITRANLTEALDYAQDETQGYTTDS